MPVNNEELLKALQFFKEFRETIATAEAANFKGKVMMLPWGDTRYSSNYLVEGKPCLIQSSYTTDISGRSMISIAWAEKVKFPDAIDFKNGIMNMNPDAVNPINFSKHFVTILESAGIRVTAATKVGSNRMGGTMYLEVDVDPASYERGMKFLDDLINPANSHLSPEQIAKAIRENRAITPAVSEQAPAKYAAPSRISSSGDTIRLGFPETASEEAIHNSMHAKGFALDEYKINPVRATSTGDRVREVIPLTERAKKGCVTWAGRSIEPEQRFLEKEWKNIANRAEAHKAQETSRPERAVLSGADIQSNQRPIQPVEQAAPRPVSQSGAKPVVQPAAETVTSYRCATAKDAAELVKYFENRKVGVTRIQKDANSPVDVIPKTAAYNIVANKMGLPGLVNVRPESTVIPAGEGDWFARASQAVSERPRTLKPLNPGEKGFVLSPSEIVNSLTKPVEPTQPVAESRGHASSPSRSSTATPETSPVRQASHVDVHGVRVSATSNTAGAVQSLVELSQDPGMGGMKKALTVANLGVNGAGLAADVAGLRYNNPGLTRFGSGLGVVGGGIGMVTSGMGLYDSYNRGDGVGVVMNSAGLVSSAAFTYASGATLFGLAGAQAATGIGVAVAIPTAAAGVMMQAAEQVNGHFAYYDQQRAFEREATNNARPQLIGTFAGAAGIPVPPKLQECKNLWAMYQSSEEIRGFIDSKIKTTLNSDQNIGNTQLKLSAGDLAELDKMLVARGSYDEYNRLQEQKQAAENELAQFAGASSTLHKTFFGSDKEKQLQDTIDFCGKKMGKIREAQSARDELNGEFGPQGTEVFGLKQRMQEYTRLSEMKDESDQPLYKHQLEQAQQIADTRNKVLLESGTVGEMEKRMNLGHEELQYFRGKVAVNFETNTNKIIALSTEKAQLTAQLAYDTELKKDPQGLSTAQAAVQEVYKAGSKAVEIVAPVVHTAMKELSTKPLTQPEIDAINSKIAALDKEIKPLQESLNQTRNYFGDKLIAAEVRKEYEAVMKMSPEQQTEYFAKNTKFIEDAKLRGNPGLHCAALSTGPDEFMYKVSKYAPELIEGEMKKQTELYNSAVVKTEAAVPDAPVKNEKGELVNKKDGTPLMTSEAVSQTLVAQKEILEQLQKRAAGDPTPTFKAQVTMQQAAIARIEWEQKHIVPATGQTPSKAEEVKQAVVAETKPAVPAEAKPQPVIPASLANVPLEDLNKASKTGGDLTVKKGHVVDDGKPEPATGNQNYAISQAAVKANSIQASV